MKDITIKLLLIVAFYTGLIRTDDAHPNDIKPFNKPGTNERPMSSFGKGYDAIYLWLKREEHTEKSKLKTHGHFYYPLNVDGTVFDLQVSTYSTVTGIVGDECSERCNVDKVYQSKEKLNQYLWRHTTNIFKNFDTTEANGFRTSNFLGRYIAEKSITLEEDGHKEQNVNQLHLFVIMNPIDETAPYVSDQSGVIGFGLDSKDKDFDHNSNMVSVLRSHNYITKMQTSYNITYKLASGDPKDAGKVDHENSYIQLGELSDQLENKLKWIKGNSFEHWTVPIDYVFLKEPLRVAAYPILTAAVQAVFDPQVDHFHVSYLHFQQFIAPEISKIYGIHVLTCDNDACFFKDKDCPTAMREHSKNVILQMNIGEKADPEQQYTLSVNLEDYVVDGKDVGMEENVCYLPIFVFNPGQDITAMRTWFLGSMFLDKYFVVNNNENARKVEGEVGGEYPVIGIYDKMVDFEPVPENTLELDEGFTSQIGKCGLNSAKEPVKNIDWKNIESGGTNEDCRRICKDDSKCSAYEWVAEKDNLIYCKHWYGEIKGNENRYDRCFVKDVPPVIVEPIPEEQHSSTAVVIILTLLLLIGIGVLIKLYGKQGLAFAQERWVSFRTGQGKGEFDSNDLYSGDPNEPLGEPPQLAPPPVSAAPPTPPDDEKPQSRLKFDD